MMKTSVSHQSPSRPTGWRQGSRGHPISPPRIIPDFYLKHQITHRLKFDYIFSSWILSGLDDLGPPSTTTSGPLHLGAFGQCILYIAICALGARIGANRGWWKSVEHRHAPSNRPFRCLAFLPKSMSPRIIFTCDNKHGAIIWIILTWSINSKFADCSKSITPVSGSLNSSLLRWWLNTSTWWWWWFFCLFFKHLSEAIRNPSGSYQ